MQPWGGGRVGGVSLLRRCEIAEMMVTPFLVDSRAPSSVSGSRHAFESRSVVLAAACIGAVLRRSCAAQIFPAIVRGISVTVVDQRRTPPAGHVQPSKVVRSVVPALDPDPATAVGVQRSGNVAGLSRSAHSLAPAKFSGLVIVIQQLAQTRGGDSRTSSHGNLTNKKGPRERPWRGGDSDSIRRARRLGHACPHG